jgi:hypothetical protein
MYWTSNPDPSQFRLLVVEKPIVVVVGEIVVGKDPVGCSSPWWSDRGGRVVIPDQDGVARHGIILYDDDDDDDDDQWEMMVFVTAAVFVGCGEV